MLVYLIDYSQHLETSKNAACGAGERLGKNLPTGNQTVLSEDRIQYMLGIDSKGLPPRVRK